jgi:hypothetical protein
LVSPLGNFGNQPIRSNYFFHAIRPNPSLGSGDFLPNFKRRLPKMVSLGGFRPEDDDFGIAPSEEWRTMSALKREIVPNIRHWGLSCSRRAASVGRRLWTTAYQQISIAVEKQVPATNP